LIIYDYGYEKYTVNPYSNTMAVLSYNITHVNKLMVNTLLWLNLGYQLTYALNLQGLETIAIDVNSVSDADIEAFRTLLKVTLCKTEGYMVVNYNLYG
jgi:hypothetical protein